MCRTIYGIENLKSASLKKKMVEETQLEKK